VRGSSVSTSAPVPDPRAAAAGPHDDWVLWQLVDSAFPTGGFAHSGGVEAAWQHGLLPDGDALAAFVRDAVRQAASAAVPIAMAVAADPAAAARWDAFYDATVTNHVANRASRAQGRALLATAAATFDAAALREAADRARRDRLACHLPTAFGATAAALGLPPAATARAYLFLIVRGCVSGAVRLGLVGPLEGQRVQAAASRDATAAAELALATPPAAVAQTAFVADLLQATQDRLYSRLFQS
jgi:urease accessory protein